MSEQINEQSNQEIPTDANPIENTAEKGEQLQKGAIDRNDSNGATEAQDAGSEQQGSGDIEQILEKLGGSEAITELEVSLTNKIDEIITARIQQAFGNTVKPPQSVTNELRLEDVKQMTPAQINANWEEITKSGALAAVN